MDRLTEIENRKREIRSLITDDATLETLQAFKAELDELDAERKQIEQRKQLLHDLHTGRAQGVEVETKENRADMKDYNSLEYRQAFMDYVMGGEMRAESLTKNNGAIIPPTVLDTIVVELEKEGSLIERVHNMAYPAGVEIPCGSINLKAEWVSEAAKANPQAPNIDGTVSFTAHQLRCTVGLSFQMRVRSLDAFEKLIARKIASAMRDTLEQAIVNGTGKGQPKGILQHKAVAEVEVNREALDYRALVNFVKSVPPAYRPNAVLLASEAFILDILAVTDNNGNPVARANIGIDGRLTYNLLGHEMVDTRYIPDYDAAGAGDVIGAWLDLKMYGLNTAYDMDLKRYTEDTRGEYFDSAMLVDGKMIDANGLVFLKKADVKAK